MNNDTRFELLVIDYLVNSVEGTIFYNKETNAFDDDFNLVYAGFNFNYTEEEVVDRLHLLEAFEIVDITNFDTDKIRFKVALRLDDEIIDVLSIEPIKETIFRTVQKLGVYSLGDLETLSYDAYNYIVDLKMKESYEEVKKEKKDEIKDYLKYESVAKDIEFNHYLD